MKVVIDWPPNIDRIREVFDLSGKNPVFSFGDILFVPGGGHVSHDLLVHEKTHQQQQGDDVEGWWERYLIDPEFRLSQELEAYSFQYKDFCDHCRGQTQRFNFLKRICTDLSGPMYGNIISFMDAMNTIRNGTKLIIKR